MRTLSLALATLLFAGSALAQTPRCDGLEPKQKALAQELFSSLHPYDCCDETLAACLAAKERCSLAARLADDVCRLVKAGKDRPSIERAMDGRAQSMVDLGSRAPIALDETLAAGDPKAPVRAVVYACARCPFCSALLPKLHQEVTEGALKGKVRLYLRPFPLKNHPGSTEGALGVLAAAKLERGWPFLLALYGSFDQFDPARLGETAKGLGLDAEAFGAALNAPQTREALVEMKKEGLRNKVGQTPSLFIDGRPYSYELSLEALRDVLEEEYERVTGK